jgi:hypothetical protein
MNFWTSESLLKFINEIESSYSRKEKMKGKLRKKDRKEGKETKEE